MKNGSHAILLGQPLGDARWLARNISFISILEAHLAEEAVSCEPVSANGFPWYQGKLQGNFRIPRPATNFVAKIAA